MRPPCSCATMVSGLTAMPVSTALVTRRKRTSPCASTSASTTVAIKLPKAGCTETPRPVRAGGHRRGLGAHILDVEIRNVVGHVDGTVDRIDIDSVLKGRRQPACDHG